MTAPEVDRLLAFGDVFFGLFMRTASDGPPSYVLGEMNRRQLAKANERFKGRIAYLAEKDPELLRRWAWHLTAAVASVSPGQNGEDL